MKKNRTGLGFALCLFLFLSFSCFVSAAAQVPPAKKARNPSTSSTFEPLDRWSAAVVAGDRAALARFYTSLPPSRAKTPQGETLDQAEEPMFWSSLGKAGIIRFDPKILEKKQLRPGAFGIVLRFEVGLRSGGGEKAGIISGSQTWVLQGDDWKIVDTQRGGLVTRAAMRLPEPAKPNTQLYPEPAEARSEIAAALAAATRDHKRVLLVFGGNWCYDCHVLDAAFHSSAILPLVDRNYHVVHVNIGEYDKNTDLAAKYQIPLEKGVPSLAILDPDGKLVVSQKKGEFQSTARLGPENVVEFLNYWKPSNVK